MSSVGGKTPPRPTVRCILCTREFERKETEEYQRAGAFENYCFCKDCVQKYRTSGWGWHQ